MGNNDLIYFLRFFLYNKSLTKKQKENRDKLIVRDYSQLIDLDSNIDPPTGNTVRYISPLKLRKLLFNFNQNEVLKYACHEIDSDDIIKDICKKCNTEQYSFIKHRELMSNELSHLLESFKKSGEYLDSKMVAIIQGFINGSKPWSNQNIEWSWHSEALLNWSRQHPTLIPSPAYNIAKKQGDNGFILPNAFRSELTGSRIQTFSDLVIFFKSLFHIKSDNPLRRIIEITNSNLKNKDKLSISIDEEHFRDNIELLTNVDKLIETYRKILNICIEAHAKNNSYPLDVVLSFYEEGESIYFCIHDKSSVYGKTLRATKERIGQQHTELIKKQINGLCDLYIEADFGSKEYAQVAIWNENSNSDFEKPTMDYKVLENAVGVKYILKFY